MPGSSLWLLPPQSHPLNSKLPTLIDRTSSHFGSAHRFLPHITLTSEISASAHSPDPQAWLDALEIPLNDTIAVKFHHLASEDVFFRKLYVKCEKGEGLRKLAALSRREVEGFEEEVAAKWAAETYNPHLSLLYHDNLPVNARGLDEVEKLAQSVGVDVTGQSDSGGWTGGRLVLVPTDKPVDQWIPIAERKL